MLRSLDGTISSLKKKVLSTCADRIEAARTKPEEKKPENDHGITSMLKRRRGL